MALLRRKARTTTGGQNEADDQTMMHKLQIRPRPPRLQEYWYVPSVRTAPIITIALVCLALSACRDRDPNTVPLTGPDVRSTIDDTPRQVVPVPFAGNPGIHHIPSPALAATDVSIVVDGLFEDWAEIDDVAPGIKIASDAERVMLSVELPEVLILNQSPDAPTLYIDADNNAESGAPYEGMGVDWLWSFGQRQGTRYDGAAGDPIRWTELGLVALPTVSAARFEVSLTRRPEWISGHVLRMELAGKRFTFALDSVRSEPPVALETEQPEGTLRIMTWNMLQDGLLDPSREQAFRVVLLNHRPDVIAFQEVWSGVDAIRTRVAGILQLPEGQQWYARGNQGRTIVSRYPIVEGWPSSSETLDSRFEVVGLDLPAGERFILINGHMSCCDNDHDRLAEAESFVAWMEDLVTPGGEVEAPPGAHIALVGDLNLVGSSTPLEVLLSARDPTGERLINLASRHADGPVAYTWRWDDGDFWPGLLDYVIYAGDTLKPVRHFVVPESSNTEVASDHLPRIVDFQLIQSRAN